MPSQKVLLGYELKPKIEVQDVDSVSARSTRSARGVGWKERPELGEDELIDLLDVFVQSYMEEVTRV